MNQMAALLKKNLLLRYRGLVELIFELCFPAILIFLMILIKIVGSKNIQIEEASYVGTNISSYFDPDLIRYSNDQSTLPSVTSSGTPQGSPFSLCLQVNATVIAFISRNPGNTDIYEYIKDTLSKYFSPLPPGLITFSEFSSNEEFENLIKDEKYKNANIENGKYKGICAGIEIKKEGKKYTAILRFDDNYSSRYSISSNKFTIIPSTSKASYDPYNALPNLNNIQLYFLSGFTYLQNLIANKIYQLESGKKDLKLRMSIIPMHTPKMEMSNYLDFITPYFPYTLGIGFIFTIFRFSHLLVTEKELRIKEMMKLMGMSSTTYWSSWIIEYIIISIIISFICTFLVSFCIMNHSNFFLLFVFYFIYEMDVFALAIFLSPFFSSANLASIGSCVIYLLTFAIGVIFTNNDFSFAVKGVFSFFSPISGTLIQRTMSCAEISGIGMVFANFNTTINDYTFCTGYVMMIVNFFVLFFLGIYLDLIIPYADGTALPFYFIFSPSFWSSQYAINNQINNLNLVDESMLGIKNYEQISEILRIQEDTGECLKIRNIEKIYGNGKLALEKLSFNLYKNQIFALLGHNGAGKTTLINILTGILAPTTGTANYSGIDFFKQMHIIRKLIGLCPQNNILFPSLTIREHLKIFSTFKGSENLKQPEKEIDLLINDLNMSDYADTIVSNLSEGQKRCLSIALAYIGNSSLIILDEPTSGMDITARRCVWGMLKKYKSNKIIILTTHFMEEADCLGDRIAIMDEGKVKCLGSPIFLKSIFGGGYTLTISKKDASQETKELIETYISKVFPPAIKISDASREIKYQLPFEEVSKFADFFKELEENFTKINVNYYSISNTNMEEVFLRVAESESFSIPIKREDSSTNDNSIVEEHETGYCNIFCIQFKALLIKRLKYLYRTKLTLITEIIIYILLILLMCINAKIVRVNDSIMRIFTLDFNLPQFYYINYDSLKERPIDIDKFFHFLSSNRNYTIQEFHFYDSNSLSEQAKLKMFDEQLFQFSNKTPFTVSFGSLYINKFDHDKNEYEFSLFVNSTSQDSAGIFASLLLNNFLQYAISPDIDLKFANYPQPVTYASRADEKGRLGINCMGSLTLVMCMVSISLISYVASEKEQFLKHMQKLYGLLLLPYWVINSTIDIIKNLIIGFLTVALWAAFSIQIDYAWLFILIYSISMVPYTYCFSFVFKKSLNAEKLIMITNFFIGVFLGILIPPLQRIENIQSFIKAIDRILQIFPIFALTRGINNSASNQQDSLTDGLIAQRSVFDLQCSGIELTSLTLSIVFYFFLLFIFELIYYKKTSKFHKVDYTNETIESDVLLEENNAFYSKPSDSNFLVKRLRKVYKGPKGESVVAINSLSLKLEKGCIFGLLGPNGAGKSTTFSLITQSEATKGEIYFYGIDAKEDPTSANFHIGFCPQYNSFFPLMTCVENLEFYGTLRGIIKSKLRIIVDKLLIDFGLVQYRNFEAGTLSGGNKRKLCVALSFIGNPSIILIDELSTGVDPQAKRHIWNSISRVKTKHKDLIMILSTHSMEEAETLTTKIGILIKGYLKCIGTSQEIKARFNHAFQIEFRVRIPDQESILKLISKWNVSNNAEFDENKCKEILISEGLEELVKEISPNGSGSDIYIDLMNRKVIKARVLAYYCIIEMSGKEILHELYDKYNVNLEEHYNIQYKVSAPNSRKPLSELFKELHNLSSHTRMQEYSLTPTTLDSIFNSFVFEKTDFYTPTKSNLSNSHILSKE